MYVYRLTEDLNANTIANVPQATKRSHEIRILMLRDDGRSDNEEDGSESETNSDDEDMVTSIDTYGQKGREGEGHTKPTGLRPRFRPARGISVQHSKPQAGSVSSRSGTVPSLSSSPLPPPDSSTSSSTLTTETLDSSSCNRRQSTSTARARTASHAAKARRVSTLMHKAFDELQVKMLRSMPSLLRDTTAASSTRSGFGGGSISNLHRASISSIASLNESLFGPEDQSVAFDLDGVHMNGDSDSELNARYEFESAAPQIIDVDILSPITTRNSIMGGSIPRYGVYGNYGGKGKLEKEYEEDDKDVYFEANELFQGIEMTARGGASGSGSEVPLFRGLGFQGRGGTHPVSLHALQMQPFRDYYSSKVVKMAPHTLKFSNRPRLEDRYTRYETNASYPPVRVRILLLLFLYSLLLVRDVLQKEELWVRLAVRIGAGIFPLFFTWSCFHFLDGISFVRRYVFQVVTFALLSALSANIWVEAILVRARGKGVLAEPRAEVPWFDVGVFLMSFPIASHALRLPFPEFLFLAVTTSIQFTVSALVVQPDGGSFDTSRLLCLFIRLLFPAVPLSLHLYMYLSY